MAEHQEALFQSYITKMKEKVKENDLERALVMAKSAIKIRDSEKLRRRILKLEECISATQDESDEEGDDMTDLGDGFFLAKQLGDKLYDYQRQGVRWLWNLFRRRKGGILGDDMGLGKTLQIIALLSGLLDLQKIKNAIIILPLTLMATWQAEFDKWTPGIEVECFHDLTKRQRERLCEKVQRRGGIILITYGMVLNNYELLAENRGRQFVWDYVILDEGHKIKNASKTTKAVHQVPAANRLVLTGTPIQNNLLELWSLYDFVHSGTLLGTATTFKVQFANPILKSREKDATKEEKRLGDRMSEMLRHRIEPYFLRRLKAEVLGKNSGDSGSNGNVPKSMSHKNDFVAWICLEKEQTKIYEKCLQLDMITEALNTKRSPLVQLTILKKICDHPRLLSARLSECLGLLDNMKNYFDGDKMVAAQLLHTLSDAQLLQESGKLKFLIELLNNLRAEGHKCLVFSQSRVMLDIIERILKNARFKMVRIDGTINSPSERQQIVHKFENDSSYSVFLLTTQVGGVGLTLTSANRVVIYDPSWNPAQDSQAVDRVYRIGQTRSVVVYRLITCGTVEERIYRRQVFKQSIHKQTVEKNSDENICRYFSRQELRDMFTLENPTSSKTQIQLESMHAAERKTTTELDGHIAFLYSLPGFFGLSDHDLLFTVNTADNEALDDVGKKHIGDWMERANKLVDLECEMTDKARTEQGKFLKPLLPESQSKITLGPPSSLNVPRKPSTVSNSEPKKKDSGSIYEPTRHQVLTDEVIDLAQDVEMLSPFKPRSPIGMSISKNVLPRQFPVANTESISKLTLHQVVDDNVVDPVQDVEMLSPFKPHNHGDSRNSRSYDQHENMDDVLEIVNRSALQNTVKEIVNLVTPNVTSNFNQESFSKPVMPENEVHSHPEGEQMDQDPISPTAMEDSGSIHSKSASILAPDSESDEETISKGLEQSNMFLVNETMDVSAIETSSPARACHAFSAKGPLNSTRISSIVPLRDAPSSEQSSDESESEEIYQSFDESTTRPQQLTKVEPASEVSKTPVNQNWSSVVLPATMSPVKDRAKASKLRRSSMFVRVVNEIEEDSYSDSESEEEDESDSTEERTCLTAQSNELSASRVDESVQSEEASASLVDESVLCETVCASRGDAGAQSSDTSDDKSASSDDKSASSDDKSASSDDQSSGSEDQSIQSPNLSIQSSEVDSPVVAKKKFKRIVVVSDSDTD